MSDNQIPQPPQQMPGAPVPPPPTYQVPPQQPYAQPPASGKTKTPGLGSKNKQKWPAVALAFALGFIGMHKFYLGYKTEGMIMLLVSAIGAICSLGLGTLVMAVIAIIEFVKYVTLTEEEFEATYVTGYKGWM